MSIIREIEAAIERNPKINRVIVSERERNAILIEKNNMWIVGLEPRPTYGPPHGEIDRLIWDCLHRYGIPEIKIMGRPVEVFHAANV